MFGTILLSGSSYYGLTLESRVFETLNTSAEENWFSGHCWAEAHSRFIFCHKLRRKIHMLIQ
ncbi:hypothetical protein SNOG_15331 [Parastagonospora nodorum SN15]|uniref:Uncharacterized protein n=1 Tax=Phaeosphaeria nodorum (strain SN15 / ATCC MYA-4574 / FGSC 10173) TaxID=321614 RepID=Q0TYQ5_PHANO|nr:hypothetical protein SNOG_15331 [Parastagonospora nodorum SN15]EAT77264.1 hypothetical protein SNOG_15331 [Parastagonospora nodorum SN15]